MTCATIVQARIWFVSHLTWHALSDWLFMYTIMPVGRNSVGSSYWYKAAKSGIKQTQQDYFKCCKFFAKSNYRLLWRSLHLASLSILTKRWTETLDSIRLYIAVTCDVTSSTRKRSCHQSISWSWLSCALQPFLHCPDECFRRFTVFSTSQTDFENDQSQQPALLLCKTRTMRHLNGEITHRTVHATVKKRTSRLRRRIYRWWFALRAGENVWL